MAAIAIVLLGLVLRFWGLTGGLPHPLSRPDEEVVLRDTVGIAVGAADTPWPAYPPAYAWVMWAWGAAGLSAGETIGIFPPGDYADVAARTPARLLLIDRTLSALVGAATVPLLMWITARHCGRSVAVIAGFLLATNLLHVRDTHAVKTEALLTLGVVWALAAIARLAEGVTIRRALGAGLAIGATTAMKYPGILLLAPAWIAAIMGSDARGVRRWLSVPAVVTAGVAGLVFLVLSPNLVLDPAARESLLSVFSSIFPSIAPRPVRQMPPEILEIAPLPAWWTALIYHARFSLRYGLGLLPALLAPLAVVWGLASRRPLETGCAVFAVVYYAVNGVSPMMLSRYMTPLVPAFAILFASALGAVANRIAPSGRARLAALLLGTMLLGGASFHAAIGHDRLAGRADTRNLATEWLTANLRPGTRLGVYGTRFWGYGEPLLPVGVEQVRFPLKPAPDLHASGVRFLLTHDHATFASHVDPAIMAALLPQLTLVADFDPAEPGSDGQPVFEFLDAYYIPVAGFGAVHRPGPHIRIYAVRDPG